MKMSKINYECESCPKAFYERRDLERQIRNNLCKK